MPLFFSKFNKMSSSVKSGKSKKTTADAKTGPPSVSSFLRVILQLESDTRLYHFYTTSHANHKATNALYAKLSEKIDEFVERALGRNRAVNVGRSFDVRVRVPTKNQLTSELKKAASFLEKELPKSLNKRSSDLITTRDDLLGEIRRTLYRLSQK